jgi:hypothetical protein
MQNFTITIHPRLETLQTRIHIMKDRLDAFVGSVSAKDDPDTTKILARLAALEDEQGKVRGDLIIACDERYQPSELAVRNERTVAMRMVLTQILEWFPNWYTSLLPQRETTVGKYELNEYTAALVNLLDEEDLSHVPISFPIRDEGGNVINEEQMVKDTIIFLRNLLEAVEGTTWQPEMRALGKTLAMAMDEWGKMQDAVAQADGENRLLGLAITEHTDPVQEMIRRVAYENLMNFFNVWYHNNVPVLRNNDQARQVFAQINWESIMDMSEAILFEADMQKHDRYWQVEGALSLDDFVAVYMDLFTAYAAGGNDGNNFRIMLNTFRKNHPEACAGDKVDERFVT